jgi:serine/threonine protein kinase
MQDANNIGANGRYVIERVLGEQTVGRYVVAVDTVAGGRVTILVPAAQAVRPQRVVDALQHEIERLRPLNDTAYCTLKDAGLTDDGQPFAVVNRPQGGSLAALLRSEGRLSPDRAVSIAIQLCDLVRRAHVLGVFPASLDPDSIIVDSQPGGRARVSVVDFGLARGLFGPTAQNATRARSSLFDAPQIRAGEEADPRDDVFAITALLHALILGVAPPTMAAHGPADGSGWPSLPDDTLDRRLEACLHTVLVRGLAPDRDDRFPHIGALQRALTGLRQLMSLTGPAFELLAATRGRLGHGPDALDMRTARPAQERALEARARIREVAAIGQSGQANFSALNEKPRARLEAAVDDQAGVRTGDFGVDQAVAAAAAMRPDTAGITRPLARLPLVRRQAET